MRAERRPSAGEAIAPYLQGIGDIGEIGLGMPLEEIRKIGGGLLDPALLPRREHQEVERPYRTGLRQPRRPLLEDEVGVGAPDAEGADAGPQRAGRGPGGETIDDVE